ncbi:lipocalin-like domain-containing protein [Tenacibaculum crassostreae]|uniref:lipocalin-like domain-containing protein n=1 Tax=Tenacibaculum crassostreae TaxID=502683 RepID=UPI003895F796
MKKVFILFVKLFSFFSLLLVSTVGFSQESLEVNQLTLGKWNVESMEIGTEKVQFAGDKNYMEFNEDGKYQVVLNEEQKNGTWKLNDESNELELDEESFKKNLKIKRLNEREMLVSALEGDVVYTMVLKK